MEYKVSNFVLLLMMGIAVLIGVEQVSSTVPVSAIVESVSKVHSNSIVSAAVPEFKVYVNYTEDGETYRGFVKGSEDDFNTQVSVGGTLKCRLNKDTSEFSRAVNTPTKLSFFAFVFLGIVLLLSLFWAPKVKEKRKSSSKKKPKEKETESENLEEETESDN